MPPLEVEKGDEGCRSDHRVAYVDTGLKRNRTFKWLTYTYRYYNKESVDKFGTWLATFDWKRIQDFQGSKAKAEHYQAVMNKAMKTFFPLVTVKRRSTNLPWMNARLRSLIKKKKGIYWREGRSEKWRRIKDHIEDTVKER